MLHYEPQGSREYLEEYYQEANSELGKQIIDSRWEFVQSHVSHGTLLDYGCGIGHFIQAAPEGFICEGYDNNKFSPYTDESVLSLTYDIVTMWDVIEHLQSPLEPIIRAKPNYVFICTPDADSINGRPFKWKHYKPGEHLIYFTGRTLMMSLNGIGFDCIGISHKEGELRNPNNKYAIIAMAFRGK